MAPGTQGQRLVIYLLDHSARPRHFSGIKCEMSPLYLDISIITSVKVLHVLGQADCDGHPPRLLPVLSQPLHLQEDQVLLINNASVINDVYN